ncbi:substrate-binding domain-containing protein [Peptoniphilus stercorisuis]|uniref:Phosphate transport system substrate-binding protein n=1 Tax=Peptoniphilus stercorisuis TaxID=1436965 RepID=A0ABS4KEK1_9FIRM|nr:substrate-binding domain-containing protein [Peptoniphilus stercorisuis]MBP2026204.1 phosphate transport system substrate-binding protein [Peptoniphilus stercorisuis]
MNLKKKLFLVSSVLVLSLSLVACGGNKDEKINVVTREQGSGTRTAFTEITGILAKDENGEEIDNTYEEAIVQNSTDAVMTTVAGDESAIGYISLGSLNDTVKALNVNGVVASAEDIKDGSYEIARNFNIVYKDGISDEVEDFLKFMTSDIGQKIVAEEGYVGESSTGEYTPINNSASITIAGSTSVNPLMEKLVERYKKYNPDFNANIQATGSSAGIKSVLDDSAELGMSSRELKDSEKDLNVEVVAIDGIAVIVNNNSKIDDLKLESIKDIFEGKIQNWTDL